MKKLLLFTVGLLLSFSLAKAQDVVINKIVNTNDGDGGGDAVELLVIKDNLDMRGMVLNYGDEKVPGYTFTNDALWNNLSAGTLIVLYRPRSSWSYPEDLDKSDGIIKVVLPLDIATNTYLQYTAGSVTTNKTNFSKSSLVAIKTAGSPVKDYTGVIHAFATGTAVNSGVLKTAWDAITAPKIKSSIDLEILPAHVATFVYPVNATKTIADFNDPSGNGATRLQILSADADYFNLYLGNPYGEGNWDYISSLQNVNNQKSLLFDGVDDKVIVKANTGFDSPNNLTLEAWIKVPEWKSAIYSGVIISKEGGNTSGYALRCGENGKLNLVVGNNGGEWKEITSPPIMSTDRWYHVAGVYENVATKVTMKLYINGNLVAQSVTENSTSIKSSTTNLLLGGSAAFGDRYFKGNMDEARVWTTSRTDAEIKSNFNNTLPAKTTGLAAYYKFNHPSGTYLQDNNALVGMIGTLTNFDASPWADGYVSSGADVAANALLSPDQLTFYAGTSRIKASFKNYGTQAANSFTVGYKVNNEAPVIETISQPLQPGEELKYSFKQVVKGVDATSNIKVFITAADDTNVSNDTLNVVYTQPVNAANEIPIFVKRLQNSSSQTQTATVTLPDNNARYKQILMNISVECPTGGCDPWDQPAKISVIKGNDEYEIGRFVTPYGKACGPWLVDVTNFKSILQGATDFKSYVQVWGSSGWLVNVSLTFVEGDTDFPYQKITALWDNDNLVYGDPGKSYDLPEKTITTSALTKELEMRMTITGHGQANTDNGAEFSDKTHTIKINGNNVATQRLWKDDCAQNTCSGQAGTWEFARAGWCPGQAVNPYILQLTPQLVAGQNIAIDYVLQPYTNLLNTGYDGSAHTEPHYKIHSYLIEKSDVPYGDNITNIAAKRIAFPTKTVDMTTATAIKTVLRNTGNTVVNSTKLYCFVDGLKVAEETSNTSIAAGDSIMYTFTTLVDLTSTSAGINKTISIIAEVANDEANSDDVTSVTLIAPQVLLPLNFISFNARLSGGHTALLNWVYQNTESMSVFEIERLNEQTNEFERIASWKKAATPGEAINAFYTDELINSGNFYYRIKHIDENGLVKYSETKVLSVTDNSGVLIFPNPVDNDLNVEFKQVKAGEVKFEIFNLSGKKVYNLTKSYKAGTNQFVIPVVHLSAGYYVLKLGNTAFNKSISFIKK